jgi:hypothetical protein
MTDDVDDLDKRRCDEDSIHREAGTEHCELCGYRGGGCPSYCENYGILCHILVGICRRFGGTFFLILWLPHNSALHPIRRHSALIFVGRAVYRPPGDFLPPGVNQLQLTNISYHNILLDNRVRWDDVIKGSRVGLDSSTPCCVGRLRVFQNEVLSLRGRK